MKTLTGTLREATNVCHGSGIYALLTRQEKKEAVIYCLRIMKKNQNEALKEGRV